jgi:hypothetical protein
MYASSVASRVAKPELAFSYYFIILIRMVRLNVSLSYNKVKAVRRYSGIEAAIC